MISVEIIVDDDDDNKFIVHQEIPSFSLELLLLVFIFSAVFQHTGELYVVKLAVLDRRILIKLIHL